MRYKVAITDEIIRVEIVGLEDVKLFSENRFDIREKDWDIIIESKCGDGSWFPHLYDVIFEIEVKEDKVVFSNGKDLIEITGQYVVNAKEYAFYFSRNGKEIELPLEV